MRGHVRTRTHARARGCITPGTGPHGGPKHARASTPAAFLLHATPRAADAWPDTTPRARPPARRICILAGDISPIDVLTHIPIICEDHHIPYIYVPSKDVSSTAL